MYVDFCPYCCQICSENATKCKSCKNDVTNLLIKSKHEYEYYLDKTLDIPDFFGFSSSYFNDLVREEIKDNPLYNDELSHIIEKQKEQIINEKATQAFKQQTQQAEANIPKCPTCGSTDLEKISDLKKATHWLAFGLLSKTARSQFRCKKCGYKW